MAMHEAETFHDDPARILQAVIEASPLAIVVLDRAGTVRLWNPGAAAMFGWSAEEALGNVNPAVPEERRAEFRSLLARQLAGAQQLGIELLRQTRDGRLLEVRLWTAPLRGSDGSISGVMVVYVDDSERKQAEEELRRARSELESRVRERTTELTSINVALREEIRERVKVEEALRASEERFRLLVEGGKDYALLMLDPRGVVTGWNLGAERIEGYTAGEIIGKHFSCFYPEEGVRSGGPEGLLRLARGTGRAEDEGWRVRKDGSRFWANVVLTALHDGEGEIRGFAKMTRDITEKRRAQEQREQLLRAIDEQRRLFQMVIEHSPSSIAIFDGKNLRVKWANPNYRNLLEEPLRNMDIVGLRLQEIVPRAEESGIVEIYRRAAATGRPHTDPEREIEGFARGKTFWREIILPLTAGEGEIPDLMVLLTDLTDEVLARKKIEDLAAQLSEERHALQLRNREVERADRMKSEFLATMSHELRTPLHSIIGFSELLAEENSGWLNDKQKRQLDHILRGARHLLSLINDILDLSKIEAGRLELNPENFVATAAVGEVLNTIAPMAAAKQIQVESELDPDLVMRADRLRFKQILYNLLSNAVKFTQEGGRVDVRIGQQEDAVELAVSDTGVGIPAEELNAVFDEFHQASATTKGVKEGTGLGLAITRRLVKLHGGDIRVNSKVGVGSRFAVRLPLHAQGPAVREGSGAPVRQGGIREATSPAKTILVADDNQDSREFIRDTLASGNCSLTEATDGNDALKKIRASPPDLVLMDIQMPGIDGYGVLREIRRDPALAEIVVVALTASAMEDDRTRALAAGFDAYIAKPVDPATLRGRIGQLLKERGGQMPHAPME